MKYKVIRMEEGVLDFARGATREVGSKLSNSGIARGARQVVQAGRDTSTIGQLSKAVGRFYTLHQQYLQAQKGASTSQQTDAQPQDHATPQPTVDDRQQARQAAAQATPAAFRTTTKPLGSVNKRGDFEYTFSSYLQQVTGNRMDEGVMDFARGAGTALGGKIVDAAHRYASRPSMIKDIMQAGHRASAEGNNRREAEKAGRLEQDTKEALALVLRLLSKLGDRAKPALKTAVFQYAGRNGAAQLYRFIIMQAKRHGIRV